MPPAARVSDLHVCPMVTPGTPPIPHVGGPIIPPCEVTVLTGKLPQARVTDKCVCVGPPDVIVKGSMTVFVGKLPAARIGDSTAHGGVITVGFPTVLIGDGGGGGSASSAFKTVVLPLGLEGKGAAPADMLDAMIAAAKEGKPFCEQCAKAAAGR